MKIKRMKRESWHRIVQREYRCEPLQLKEAEGLISILILKEVNEPLYVADEEKQVLIADNGYAWLQIALKDQFIWITAMFDTVGNLLQVYFDISNGTVFDEAENPCFEDLYLDIVLTADGRLYILDKEELEEALQQGEISKEKYDRAIVECDKLYRYLTVHKENVMNFCKEWYDKLRSNLRS